MLYLILFIMIGLELSVSPLYWVVFTLACVCWLIKVIANIIEKLID